MRNEMRDRLIELIDIEYDGEPNCLLCEEASDKCQKCEHRWEYKLADHLIENGVIVIDTNVISPENRPLITQFADMPLDEVFNRIKADVVEVVRCKDCKYYLLHKLACAYPNHNGWCNINDIAVMAKGSVTMAEYIDREKIFPNKVFYVNENNPMASLDELINRIYSIPAADVIPVVRCKNCVYANDKGDTCHFGEGRFVTPDHYCSYGERKCDNE